MNYYEHIDPATQDISGRDRHNTVKGKDADKKD
jgi:hypothetical protein